VAPATKIGKLEDKLPLDRALRALEDVHQSLKEFAKKESVAENVALSAGVKTIRHKAKKLRNQTAELAEVWNRIFGDKT
jgi:hypothetical protein